MLAISHDNSNGCKLPPQQQINCFRYMVKDTLLGPASHETEHGDGHIAMLLFVSLLAGRLCLLKAVFDRHHTFPKGGARSTFEPYWVPGLRFTSRGRAIDPGRLREGMPLLFSLLSFRVYSRRSLLFAFCYYFAIFVFLMDRIGRGIGCLLCAGSECGSADEEEARGRGRKGYGLVSDAGRVMMSTHLVLMLTVTARISQYAIIR